MNVNANGTRCWDGSMLAATVGDAIKGMKMVEEEGKKIEEQKNKNQTLNLNLSAKEEYKDENRLLGIKA